MTRIVILGAGTAGTIMANRLRRLYQGDIAGGRISITVVDSSEQHVYQPGLLFVPFGKSDPSRIVRPRRRQLHRAVRYVFGAIDHVDTSSDTVFLTDETPIHYDVLIFATGTRIVPAETEGLTGDGWHEKMFDFYTLEGAVALRDALAKFDRGRLVLNVVEMPIKCPVAPLEFLFLADAYFTDRGIRDQVDITYATPLEGAFTRPVAARELGALLAKKNIHLETEFNAGRVDGPEGKLFSWDEREVPFDLLVTIPLHQGAEYVSRSPGLGDENGFVKTDPHTLQAQVASNVFALGDATNLPASKAGSVAHFQSEVLTHNVRRYIAGRPLVAEFDGHANCFVETGHGRALLCDFNYDVEPLPGHFPLPGIGPMTLLGESRLNHLGKLAFEWIYWNVLMRGWSIPGIGARMSMRGKRRVAAPPPPPKAPSAPSAPVQPPITEPEPRREPAGAHS